VQILSGLRVIRFFAILIPLFSTSFAEAQDKKSIAQFGGDKTTLRRKENLVLLRGNAFVIRENEVIRADEIDYNSATEHVNARGRVVYQFSEYTVRADAIDLDLAIHVGTVYNGSVSNGRFTLRGSRLDQEGLTHFQVKDFNYSTCFDCPNSWEMTGRDVDVTLESYAYIHDFVFKVKDASLFWLPFAVVPVKTQRQSGVLFPRFGVNQVYGPFSVIPYYWAINPWSDMTFGLGYYGSRGTRFEWEGRYTLTDRSNGNAHLYWTRDSSVNGLSYRYAIRTQMTQELPFGFEGKLRLNEVSDSGYPITYSEDVPGRLEPVLASDLFFSRNDPGVSTVLSLRRFRNLLQFDSNNGFVRGLDGRTVQEFPRIVVNSNDKFVFGQKLAAGVETRFNRFTRSAGPFDYFTAGGATTETIREANRFTLIPNIYTTLNPRPWLSVTPSLQYRSFIYNFDGIYPDMVRGYLLGQAEVSFQLERTFRSSKPGVSYKHTIRPLFTYSVIPFVQSPLDHPFIDQVQSQARPGQYFDNSDIVPKRATQNLNSYFTPLGNSLTYGVVSQLFRKETRAGGDSEIGRRFEAGLTQTLDIQEAERFIDSDGKDDRIVLSPLFTHFNYADRDFSASVEYTYYSYLERYQNAQLVSHPNPHRLSVGMSWTLERMIRQGLLRFERSLSANYTFSKLTAKVSSLQTSGRFSINDYIMPRAALSYNLVTGNFALLDSQLGVLFQSPSRCWQLEVGLNRSIDRGTGPVLNFALNFSGESYGTVDDALKK
jgi:lipopolysaccharide assembly outer membrane protein LptD (OstA)